MSIHLTKGIQLALALLAPVLATTLFNWRALVTARRLDSPDAARQVTAVNS